MPAAARRTDEVVKRCRPAGQGLVLKVARDRPSGLAALVNRLAAICRSMSRSVCSAKTWWFLVGELQQHGTRLLLLGTGLAPFPGDLAVYDLGRFRM